jgi:hypothetical protein
MSETGIPEDILAKMSPKFDRSVAHDRDDSRGHFGALVLG